MNFIRNDHFGYYIAMYNFLIISKYETKFYFINGCNDIQDMQNISKIQKSNQVIPF